MIAKILKMEPGRNKLYMPQVEVTGNNTETIGEALKEVTDAMTSGKCKGGEIVEKTLTFRFYPAKKESFCLKAMAMVRPAKK